MSGLRGRHNLVKAPLRAIADIAGVSHWTVRAAIEDLECSGRVEVIHRGVGAGGGRGAAGCYRMVRA